MTPHSTFLPNQYLKKTCIQWIILSLALLGFSSCDVLGLDNKLDVKIIVYNQAGGFIERAWVTVSEAAWDSEIGMVAPGQYVLGKGSILTDEDGVAFFEDIRKGNISVIIEVPGYRSHWEVFSARTGPVFTKNVTLYPR